MGFHVHFRVIGQPRVQEGIVLYSESVLNDFVSGFHTRHGSLRGVTCPRNTLFLGSSPQVA